MNNRDLTVKELYLVGLIMLILGYLVTKLVFPTVGFLIVVGGVIVTLLAIANHSQRRLKNRSKQNTVSITKQAKKHKNVFSNLEITIIVITAITLALLITYRGELNYLNYKNMLFGSPDVYSQNESLYFDEIKVDITRANQNRNEACEKEWKNLSICHVSLEDTRQAKNIEVNYKVTNLTNKPIDLTRYKFYLSGHDDIPYNTPLHKQYDLLANQSKYNTISVYVLVDFNSPVAFVVSKNESKKQINLNAL